MTDNLPSVELKSNSMKRKILLMSAFSMVFKRASVIGVMGCCATIPLAAQANTVAPQGVTKNVASTSDEIDAHPTAATDELLIDSAPHLGTAEEILSMNFQQVEARYNSLPVREKAAIQKRIDMDVKEASSKVADVKISNSSSSSQGALASLPTTPYVVANNLEFSSTLSGFFSYRANPGRLATLNWNEDGCSVPKPISDHIVLAAGSAQYFNHPCIRHDFGYGNFGAKSKLKLGSTDYRGTKDRIDRVFQNDMYAMCKTKFESIVATAFYAAVRKYGDGAFGL